MKCLLLLLCCFFIYPVLAQRTETQVSIGSGFFFFDGKSAEKNQNAHLSPVYGDPYTRPYGRKPGLSATIELMLKRANRHKFIFGIGAGYQRLSSRSTIDTVFILGDFNPTVDTFVANDGESRFKGNFINVTPFAGRRFVLGKAAIDLTGGVELGFILKSREDVSVDGLFASDIEKDLNPRDLDVRLHLSADVNIRKLVIFAKYARGITNYYTPYTGAQPEAYSNFIQLGVGYRLK